jgi:hypothetical protein
MLCHFYLIMFKNNSAEIGNKSGLFSGQIGLQAPSQDDSIFANSFPAGNRFCGLQGMQASLEIPLTAGGPLH